MEAGGTFTWLKPGVLTSIMRQRKVVFAIKAWTHGDSRIKAPTLGNSNLNPPGYMRSLRPPRLQALPGCGGFLCISASSPMSQERFCANRQAPERKPNKNTMGLNLEIKTPKDAMGFACAFCLGLGRKGDPEAKCMARLRFRLERIGTSCVLTK